MAAMVRTVVFLCFCLTASQVRGSHIPKEMNRTLQNLMRHYDLPPEVRLSGKPVFSREKLTGKMEAQKVYLGGVLETYEKLFSHMIKQQPTPSPQTAGNAVVQNNGDDDVRGKLGYILKMVHDLRKHRYQEQETLLQNLQSLKHIKMDSLEVQSKALWELPWLYEEASSLVNTNSTIKQLRRRRQARRRFKSRPQA
ncbi:interferon gamma-like [Halichoeres trimaculatus]|uniref:interferon gamma-like n=1 Tax=Halichoeres trimaculatus TaxID=147232 RepID=UPI003D9EACDB